MSSFLSFVLFIRFNCPFCFQSFPIPLLYPYLLVSTVRTSYFFLTTIPILLLFYCFGIWLQSYISFSLPFLHWSFFFMFPYSNLYNLLFIWHPPSSPLLPHFSYWSVFLALLVGKGFQWLCQGILWELSSVLFCHEKQIVPFALNKRSQRESYSCTVCRPNLKDTFYSWVTFQVGFFLH